MQIYSSPGELLDLFHKLLKKNVSFRWGEEQQAALQIKDVVSSILTMTHLLEGLPLIFYLTLPTNSLVRSLCRRSNGWSTPSII